MATLIIIVKTLLRGRRGGWESGWIGGHGNILLIVRRGNADEIDGTWTAKPLYTELITKDNGCQIEAVKAWIMGYLAESLMRLQSTAR